MTASGLAVLLGMLGCAASSIELRAEAEATGVRVSAQAPVDEVEIWDASGRLIQRQRLPEPGPSAWLAGPFAEGERYRAVAGGAEAWLEIPVRGPVELELEAPVGQGRIPVVDGEVVPVVRFGGHTEAAVVLTAREPGPIEVRIDREVRQIELGAVGERVSVAFALVDRPVELEVAGIHVRLEPRPLDLDAAREAVRIERVAMPTGAAGEVDRARPADRVSLPSRWWRALLQRAGLGYRPRDDQAPWAWQTVRIRNNSDAPVHLVVRSRILDGEGAPARAFLPRLRESTGDAVQVLLRAPPGRSVDASLPIFVDGSALPGNAAFTREIEVIPLGATEPLHRIERSLFVSRGSRWASGWLAAALLASGAGWLWLIAGAGRWVARARTADLVTIALFGSITWVAGTALQIAGLGVSALLGPFSPLLTGIADDALRACLLGTLILLVPRPGTAALATAIGFVMRGLTMGTFHPVDLLYLGSAVFWLEAWLWLSGCTRSSAWRDRPVEVWARLTVGLGGSNVCAAATAIVVSVVFYRLYFAGWYVALILALPGFLYIALGCALAVRFGGALRRVEG